MPSSQVAKSLRNVTKAWNHGIVDHRDGRQRIENIGRENENGAAPLLTGYRYRKRVPKLVPGNPLSPLRRSAGYIAGYYRDSGDIAGGGVVVVLRRWLLEEEPREHHHVAYSIWMYNESTLTGIRQRDEECRRCCRIVAPPITERFEDEKFEATHRAQSVSPIYWCA